MKRRRIDSDAPPIEDFLSEIQQDDGGGLPGFDLDFNFTNLKRRKLAPRDYPGVVEPPMF